MKGGADVGRWDTPYKQQGGDVAEAACGADIPTRHVISAGAGSGGVHAPVQGNNEVSVSRGGR